MGYDKDMVDDLPEAGAPERETEIEEYTRRRDVFTRDEGFSRAMQEIEYYELIGSDRLRRRRYCRTSKADLRRWFD